MVGIGSSSFVHSLFGQDSGNGCKNSKINNSEYQKYQKSELKCLKLVKYYQ